MPTVFSALPAMTAMDVYSSKKSTLSSWQPPFFSMESQLSAPSCGHREIGNGNKGLRRRRMIGGEVAHRQVRFCIGGFTLD